MKSVTRYLLVFVCTAIPSFAQVSYTCAASISTSVCGTLNTTIADLYSSTFTDANASIYIQYGTSGLGSNEQYLNFVSYSSYRTALATYGNDAAALASLPSGFQNPVVSGDYVAVTSALEAALHLNGSNAINFGINSLNQSSCTIGGANCYNDIITINQNQPLYYRNGSPSGDYDFFTVVQHETDEALGTISCLGTSAGSPVDDCSGTSAGRTVYANSAADLYRYSAPATRSFLGTGGNQANGSSAYFSTNNGTTDIVNYNNSPNGADYGDFSTMCASVQDAYGCIGQGGLDITNDGGAAIKILNAVGYDVVQAPEPGTVFLFAAGLSVIIGFLRRRAA